MTRSEGLAALQPTAVNAILAEMNDCQAQGKNLVSLMRGEPDFPTPAHIVEATSGSTFGIYAALTALLNEGDEVLLPDPIYDAYHSPIRLAGGRIGSVATEIRNKRFVITEEALPPEGGFFAMADVRKSGFSSNEIRKRLMHEHGVAVVHGAAYGPGGEGTLRLSFASGGDTLTRGLDRLSEGLTRILESPH